MRTQASGPAPADHQSRQDVSASATPRPSLSSLWEPESLTSAQPRRRVRQGNDRCANSKLTSRPIAVLPNLTNFYFPDTTWEGLRHILIFLHDAHCRGYAARSGPTCRPCAVPAGPARTPYSLAVVEPTVSARGYPGAAGWKYLLDGDTRCPIARRSCPCRTALFRFARTAGALAAAGRRPPAPSKLMVFCPSS